MARKVRQRTFGADDPTFGKAAEEYVTYVTRRGLKPTTLRRYVGIARKNLCPEIGLMHLSTIDRTTMVALRDDLDECLSPSSINQARVVILGVYRCARRLRGYSGPNASEWFEAARLERPGEIDVYSPADVERLITAASSPMDRAIFACAAYAGLRKSEVRALRWRDVDAAKSAINVRAGLTEGVEGRPKSGQGRTIPMVSRVAELLGEHLEAQRELQIEQPTSEDRVFHEFFHPLGPGYLLRHYDAATRRAGLRPLRFHDLRHSFITMAVRVYPITDVQHYAGHADIKTTLRYVHFKPQTDAAALLDAHLAEQNGEADRRTDLAS